MAELKVGSLVSTPSSNLGPAINGQIEKIEPDGKIIVLATNGRRYDLQYVKGSLQVATQIGDAVHVMGLQPDPPAGIGRLKVLPSPVAPETLKGGMQPS